MPTHKQLMTLLSRAGYDNDARHELVYAWTSGRSKSSKDLTQIELDELVAKIQEDFKFSRTDAQIENLKRQKRSTVLAIATRTGIKKPERWAEFNSFMLASSILKKPLNKYKLDELDKLIKQFKSLELNYECSAAKAGTKAWHHATGIPKISSN